MFFIHDAINIRFSPPIPDSKIESLKHTSRKDAKAAKVRKINPDPTKYFACLMMQVTGSLSPGGRELE
jgi:hypothetical protein